MINNHLHVAYYAAPVVSLTMFDVYGFFVDDQAPDEVRLVQPDGSSAAE